MSYMFASDFSATTPSSSQDDASKLSKALLSVQSSLSEARAQIYTLSASADSTSLSKTNMALKRSKLLLDECKGYLSQWKYDAMHHRNVSKLQIVSQQFEATYQKECNRYEELMNHVQSLRISSANLLSSNPPASHNGTLTSFGIPIQDEGSTVASATSLNMLENEWAATTQSNSDNISSRDRHPVYNPDCQVELLASPSGSRPHSPLQGGLGKAINPLVMSSPALEEFFVTLPGSNQSRKCSQNLPKSPDYNVKCANPAEYQGSSDMASECTEIYLDDNPPRTLKDLSPDRVVPSNPSHFFQFEKPAQNGRPQPTHETASQSTTATATQASLTGMAEEDICPDATIQQFLHNDFYEDHDEEFIQLLQQPTIYPDIDLWAQSVYEGKQPTSLQSYLFSERFTTLQGIRNQAHQLLHLFQDFNQLVHKQKNDLDLFDETMVHISGNTLNAMDELRSANKKKRNQTKRKAMFVGAIAFILIGLYMVLSLTQLLTFWLPHH